ncbi:MAG TPA: hypothetical protein VKT77_19720 [Chthonomonadaceae bacterium]|nr:hypothetical protein [Chthonomonadaceae bacterium]
MRAGGIRFRMNIRGVDGVKPNMSATEVLQRARRGYGRAGGQSIGPDAGPRGNRRRLTAKRTGTPLLHSEWRAEGAMTLQDRPAERGIQLTEAEALGLLELVMTFPKELDPEQRDALVKLSDYCRQFLRDVPCQETVPDLAGTCVG